MHETPKFRDPLKIGGALCTGLSKPLMLGPAAPAYFLTIFTKQILAVLKAKMKIKNPRIRAGIGTKPLNS